MHVHTHTATSSFVQTRTNTWYRGWVAELHAEKGMSIIDRPKAEEGEQERKQEQEQELWGLNGMESV